MRKKITDSELIELIEGNPNPELEKSIEGNKELKRRFEEIKEVLMTIELSDDSEVPAHIQMNFQEAIRQEQSKQNNKFSWQQIAASVAILIVGFGLGKFSDNSDSSELAAMRSEIESLKEVTLTSALQQYSASERIMAVSRIEESKRQINPELMATLINTLNSDESPNVRYAALQALSGYVEDSEVRAELVKSLESQIDPLIQISLITILTEAEERSAIAPLKDILKDEKFSPEVKHQAEIAIQVLT